MRHISACLLLSIFHISVQQYYGMGPSPHISRPGELARGSRQAVWTTVPPPSTSKPLSSENHNHTQSATTIEKCIQTKLSYEVFPFYYTWRIENLLDYLKYCQKFKKYLRLTSPNLEFDSAVVNGYWKFSFIFDPPINRLGLEAIYHYNSKKGPEFEVLCKIRMNDLERSLPTIQSTERVFIWQNITDIVEEFYNSYNETIEILLTMNYYRSVELSSASGKSNHSCEEEEDSYLENKRSSAKPSSLPPFAAYLKEMMHDEKYVDVAIKTKNNTYAIQAHRIILSMSSPILATLVYNSTFDKNESILHMPDVDQDVAEKLILYLYTGETDDIDDMADRLIVVAQHFELSTLKEICEKILIRDVKFQNALKMYSLGVEILSPKLTKKAFGTMKEHKAKLAGRSEEFKILSAQYPNLMFELFVS